MVHIFRDLFSRIPTPFPSSSRYEEHHHNSKPPPPTCSRSAPSVPRLVDHNGVKHAYQIPIYVTPSIDIPTSVDAFTSSIHKNSSNLIPSSRPSRSCSISHGHGRPMLPKSNTVSSRRNSYDVHMSTSTSNIRRDTSFNHSLSSSSASASHGHEDHHPNSISSKSRVSSSSSISKPALKQPNNHNSSRSSSDLEKRRRHVSFVNPNRPQTLHMHPLLASSAHTPAPISYDILYSPSVHSIVDRMTGNAVPKHLLDQSATDPPTFERLVLRSEYFPWVVVAVSGSLRLSGQKHSATKSRKFYIEDSLASHSHPGSSHTSHSHNHDLLHPITTFDVLYAVYTTLHHTVTQEEWDSLGHSDIRTQRRAAKAYERRCRILGGGWDEGVRRVDWLGERTKLSGVTVDKSEDEVGVAKLVFRKGE